MNQVIFNHELTPLFLQVVNEKLAACLVLSDASIPTDDFSALIKLRDRVIRRALKQMDSEVEKAFAAKELEINNKLEKLARGLLDSAKDEAVQYSRGRAALKKYK
ncbi:hypothetical protein [Alteromonas stellipolaris]|uniref:hypothetical protein n=1 Tax=Alteromonas stellipolaris TaxID=233316 RepID=UPI0007B43AD2|nr:hypothetical protein [Alteromonas stellipolaris]ANB26375.1 hypothetical protein A6F57_14975 [Alteromonas stellipolaris]MDP2597876.1 hypothetical protein [Alteromonas stellipolaris]